MATENDRSVSRRLPPRTAVRWRRFSTAAGEATEYPREYLLEHDRFIHRDLRRRTGAIVFSSSRGSERSYESHEIQNGYFTQAIIEALTDGDTDRISTDKLRERVKVAVPEMTGGCQHPTVDRDNIHRTFSFPLRSSDATPRSH